ncbi:MAG: HAMP domain-containing sensor histidine kinase [Bacteroidota bacterium]
MSSKTFDINLHSIKSRLILAVCFLAIIVTSLFLVYFKYNKKTDQIREKEDIVQSLLRTSLLLTQNDGEFFNLEIKNAEFHQLVRSSYLDEHDSLIQESYELIERLSLSEETQNGSDQDSPLKNISSQLTKYESSFQNLLILVLIRGFEDYGLEGSMRHHAHKIELNHSSEIAHSNVLMLRRHEKDYLLRGDSLYVALLNDLTSEIISGLKPDEKNKEAIELLNEYRDTFNELVGTVNEMGRASNEGLYGQLFAIKKGYFEQLNNYESQLLDQTQTELSRVSIVYNFILGSLVTLCFLFLIYLSYRITKPINRLSLFMESVKTKKYENAEIIKPNSRISEIKNLYTSFEHLLQRTRHQIEEIEEKSILLEKQNSNLKVLNEELDRFLYSAAHDLRSPLTSILGLIDITRKDMRGTECMLYLDMMEKSVKKLELYIQDVVNYAKNKNLDLTASKVDLKPFIEELLEEFEFIRGTESIERSVYFEINTAEAYTDVKRLKIILFNLISNAFRYADHEKPNPFVHIIIICNKDLISIKVKDNGLGISNEYLVDIFNMFFRASEASQGSGLGLYIVKGTLKKMNGDIDVHSIEGEGTEFTIRIPNMIREVEEIETRARKFLPTL